MTDHFVRGVSLPRASGSACGNHVSGITTGQFPGFYDYEWTTWRISEVVEALRRGDRFLFGSQDGGRTSELETFTCTFCGRETLRSVSHGVPNDDLDGLPVY